MCDSLQVQTLPTAHFVCNQTPSVCADTVSNAGVCKHLDATAAAAPACAANLARACYAVLCTVLCCASDSCEPLGLWDACTPWVVMRPSCSSVLRYVSNHINLEAHLHNSYPMLRLVAGWFVWLLRQLFPRLSPCCGLLRCKLALVLCRVLWTGLVGHAAP